MFVLDSGILQRLMMFCWERTIQPIVNLKVNLQEAALIYIFISIISYKYKIYFILSLYLFGHEKFTGTPISHVPYSSHPYIENSMLINMTSDSIAQHKKFK